MNKYTKLKLKELRDKFPKQIEEGKIHVATIESKNPHYHIITFLLSCEIAVYVEPSYNLDGGKYERNAITSWLRRNGYKFTTRNAQDVGAYLY